MLFWATTQPTSASVPSLAMPPPRALPKPDEPPPLTVRPEIVTPPTPEPTVRTGPLAAPATVRALAPGPWRVRPLAVIAGRAALVAVIVWPLREGSKVITDGPGSASAAWMAARSDPGPASAAVLTRKAAGTQRPSRHSSLGRQRPRAGGRAFRPGRPARGGNECGLVMAYLSGSPRRGRGTCSRGQPGEDRIECGQVARAGRQRAGHQSGGAVGAAGQVAHLVQDRRQQVLPARRRRAGQRHQRRAGRELLVLRGRRVHEPAAARRVGADRDVPRGHVGEPQHAR